MPDRFVIRPTMPDQADVMYSINTIHEQADDVMQDVSAEKMAQASGAGRSTRRFFQITMLLALSAAVILIAVLVLSLVLGR